jgi:hypothetical protein
MAQVDEITIVGQYMFGCKAGALTITPKGIDAERFERRGSPLALILGKEREGRCSDLLRVQWRILYATANADMGSDVFHGCTSTE